MSRHIALRSQGCAEGNKSAFLHLLPSQLCHNSEQEFPFFSGQVVSKRLVTFGDGRFDEGLRGIPHERVEQVEG